MPDSTTVSFEPGSYRDRDGRVFYGRDGAVYRALSPRALAEWRLVRATRFFERGLSQGNIVGTTEVDSPEVDAPEVHSSVGQVGKSAAPEDQPGWAGVLRHDRIPFISYPYEWTFGMLQDAALLHLELLEQALDEGFSIKDGTAYNVQWIGARPVFIDVASFDRLEPGQPWAGYRQFCQTFLYPLFLAAYKSFDFHPLLRGGLDGIRPGECARLMSARDWLRRGVLSHVVLHARLESNRRVSETDLQRALPRAGFSTQMIRNNVGGLKRIVGGLKWDPPASTWSEYGLSHSYTPADKARKEAFVREALQGPRDLVWDLGANTGEYSLLAAENSRQVVAVDGDHLAVERLYRALKGRSQASGGKVLPLVGSIADPSPNLGWRGRERKTLAERGAPDLILCLALVHHLVIGSGIPMHELLEWLSGLGPELVIEWVDRQDPMVQVLMRNRRDGCADYHATDFEHWLDHYFQVMRSEALASGTRKLYHARARFFP